MSCISRLTQELHQKGFRMTPQRLAILAALHEGGHLSPLEVYERVAKTGLTETTVYRTLEFLAGNGFLLVANRGSGHLAYELAIGSHHHILCRTCGAQVDLVGNLFQPVFQRISETTGFSVETGHLTLSGLCPACRVKFDPTANLG